MVEEDIVYNLNFFESFITSKDEKSETQLVSVLNVLSRAALDFIWIKTQANIS